MERQRILGLIGFAGLLIYAGWIGGPYLRSIIVRDAAVTTWISVASSPIGGYVDTHTLHPGTRIGPDRRIATVKNPLVDGTPVAKAQADLDRAKEHIAALQGLAADLQASADVRALEAADFAAAFKLDLDQRIAGAGNNMASIRNRLGLERDRLARLSATGHASQAAADVAAGLVMEYERALTNVQAEFDRATLRRAAAERGVLLLDDAEDGAVALRSLEDIRLSLARTTLDLAVAKAEADHAEAILAQARGNYERARLEHIEAPAGSMVWSLIASPGEAVQPGSPIVSWIDCNIMLVDVPVSDVEAVAGVRGRCRARGRAARSPRHRLSQAGRGCDHWPDGSRGCGQGTAPGDRTGARQTRSLAHRRRSLSHRGRRLCRLSRGRPL